MFQMLGVFAEFERALIQERVRAGLARARAQGKRLGRPPVGREVEAAVRAARGAGKGIRRIATELGIGVGTVQRIVGKPPRSRSPIVAWPCGPANVTTTAIDGFG